MEELDRVQGAARRRVVKHAAEFEPTELVTLVRVTGGTVEPLSPPAELEAIHAPS